MNNTTLDPTGALPVRTSPLERAANIVVRISVIVAGVALLGMVANVFFDVTLRTGINTPIQGTNQFVSYWWMLPLTFFGLAAAQKFGEHTDLPLVYDRLTPRGKPVMMIIALTCISVFVALIGWFGLENAFAQASIGEYDASTGVSTWPPRFAVPLACLFFLTVLVAQIIQEVKALLNTPAEFTDADAGSASTERDTF
ncbi:TRAP-T family transporter, DctQ (4 TMs) subunit [Corynebacterium maris DSM 45190]|uniref:TRAP-T family transporter, DctQ (4 TMs) subunit n=1 Tax=Corynebacterium maris DSM 45190 TaxID=1224163 RepID=S5SVV6_9CORY|nr:TRAP transporter small permease [Corynebacterium maris]AGS35354.1 TRAP-T family transporter, DctQ (4 TMs) subunit [Corynebacterium maris DSM 45190]